jgi:hypothetical protein
MFEGNWESSNLICVVGEQLPHTVVQNTGWQWVNEGTAVKPKWGFVTWQVGATLVLKVDTRKTLGKPDGQQDTATAAAAAAGPAAAPDPAVQAGSSAASASSPAKVGAAAVTEGKQTELAASEASAAAEPLPVRLSMNNDEVIELPPLPDMIVWVGYVKSWRDMGTASFNCIKGCSCQGTSIDALHDLGNTQQHMVKLYATEAAECLIEVKVGLGAAAGHMSTGMRSWHELHVFFCIARRSKCQDSRQVLPVQVGFPALAGTQPPATGWHCALLATAPGIVLCYYYYSYYILNWVRATPDRPFMTSKSLSQTRLIGHVTCWQAMGGANRTFS